MHSIHRFDSVGAYADAAAKLEASPAWRKAGYAQKTQQDGGEDWNGSNTFAQALDFARLGWPAGLEALQTARAAMPRPTARGRARRFDVAGMFPDTARAAAGDPCSMVTRAPGERKGKRVLPLVMPGSSGSTTKGSTIANQATAICGLIDALESSGVVRCELYRHFSSRAGAHEQTVIVRLKSAEDALELSRLAGALSPSTYRRLYLRFTENNPASGWAKAAHSNYGCIRSAATDAELFHPGALILPLASNLDDATPADAWRTITRWADANGFPLETA